MSLAHTSILWIKKTFLSLFHKRKFYTPVCINDTKLPYSAYEIAVYFSAGANNIYQIEQWLNTFTLLDQEKKIIFIVRRKSSFNWLKTHTSFPIIYCQGINDLTKTYEENNFKCIVYVNNGLQNFQSLMCRTALHIHINHGESEKTSTLSNQINAYNYVFIVADAAYDKYNLNLIDKDMHRFIKIGRPQLENIKTKEPFKTKKKVILYAPTWEGTHESMNYTSLNDFGLSIVEQLIKSCKYYLVYKPHPNTGSRDVKTKHINRAIINTLNNTSEGEVFLHGDINSIYANVDLAIFDNSAVAIDYLYVNKPMLISNLFHRIKKRQNKPKIIHAAELLDKEDLPHLTNIIEQHLTDDPLKSARHQIKNYFLGTYDYAHQESTNNFIQHILELTEKRDSLIHELSKKNEKAKI